MEALNYVADRKAVTVDNLTIPSQIRYIKYFSNMLDGVKPRSEPLLLRRVIMNSIPTFGHLVPSDGTDSEPTPGCCPYVQLFKCGRLIATSTPDSSAVSTPSPGDAGKKNIKLKWINQEEGCASFHIDSALQGDILLRVRHAHTNGSRMSMFRAAFHTGYVPLGVLRLTKAQLDGANEDDRFSDDFFIDLIFAPIEKSSSSPTTITSSSSAETASATTADTSQKIIATGVPSDSGLTIDASSADRYEMSIHRDSR